ncbi:MAG: endonuclease/exonuclease/phosphatase family protein [Planctomycetes bacterium]|nr:endonuclease/exonuclease/phosphatase family protein [Planctomycetota bacterium]
MRVMTYNIHKGIGGRDRLYRLERVIDAIRTQRPDIVCLQEVDRHVKRSRFDDQPTLLAETLEFEHIAYQFNHRVGEGRGPGTGPAGYGNLVLSREPITQRHNLSLRIRGRKNRRAQLVVIETQSGPVRLINWHLGLSEKERHSQVAKLLETDRFRRYAGMPTLLAGDCNDWRNTLHRGALARNELAQITAPPSRFRSFPAYMPVGSLDKAFCCNRVVVERAHIVKSRLTSRASDHLPLVIDFKLS